MEISTLPFPLSGEQQWQEIPETGFNEFTISSSKKASTFRGFLENNLFTITIYDQEKIFGTSTFDLSSLGNDKAEMTRFGLKFLKKSERIFSGQHDEVTGIIKISVSLKQEGCALCKICKKVFKNSIIRRHLGQGECHDKYDPEDMKLLIEQSIKRKNSKQSERERRNYDPDVRAERHKNSYDAKKRKNAYNAQKRSEVYKKSMKDLPTEEKNKIDMKKTRLKASFTP